MMFRQMCLAALMVFAGTGAASAQQQNPDCVWQGKELFAQKKYKDAVRALEKCSDDPTAWAPLGLAYFELSYMDDAKSYLKKAIEKDPDNLRLRNAYAGAFAYNREFMKAIEEYQMLLKAHPTDRGLRKGLAQALGWNKQYAKAISLYRELIKEDPQDYESWIQIGVLISWDKKFKEAVSEYRLIIGSKPPQKWETEARIRMAEVISWQKKFGEAIAEYESAKKVDPTAIDAYLGAGQVFEWQGRYQDARKEYEKALQIDPQNKKAKGYLQQLMWVK